MCCDDAQPGACVEEEQEVNDVRRHGEVAQDEVEGAVWGGVEGLAGVEGEDKTKMDKCSGFWQVDLTAAAQELLAFITPKGRVFKWKVMPFGVANAPALFQELMNKFLYILRRRPLAQELISWGAEMEAHIDNVSLGTNTQEDHVLLLREFFNVCQKNNSESNSKNVSL